MTDYLLRENASLRRVVQGVAFKQPTNIVGGDGITNIVVMSQVEYDALPVKSDTTLYLII